MVLVNFDGGCLDVEEHGRIGVYGFTIRLGNKIWQSGKIIEPTETMDAMYAEYTGLRQALRGLKWLKEKGHIPTGENVLIRGDNKSVCLRVDRKKVSGIVSSKRSLLIECIELMPKNAKIQWVPRSGNKTADALCNRALNDWKKLHGLKLKRPNGIKARLDPVRQQKEINRRDTKVLVKAGEWETVAKMLRYTSGEQWSERDRRFIRTHCGNFIPPRFKPLFGEIINVWNALNPQCTCGKCKDL